LVGRGILRVVRVHGLYLLIGHRLIIGSGLVVPTLDRLVLLGGVVGLRIVSTIPLIVLVPMFVNGIPRTVAVSLCRLRGVVQILGGLLLSSGCRGSTDVFIRRMSSPLLYDGVFIKEGATPDQE
jgi:hypothetical protein